MACFGALNSPDHAIIKKPPSPYTILKLDTNRPIGNITGWQSEIIKHTGHHCLNNLNRGSSAISDSDLYI